MYVFILLMCAWTHTPLHIATAAAAAAAAKSLQLCPTLCDPMDCSPPGSPVLGILQARTLERVAISFSNAWKWKVKVKLLSRVWLSDPMDCSLPGSSVRGVFQARVLEWGAIAFSVILPLSYLNNHLIFACPKLTLFSHHTWYSLSYLKWQVFLYFRTKFLS